mmetsp:Transcript_69591/g.145382  ORF Transcript_69591/g.145382 Transcript_69591/m.145382 type:complete len:304 (-) Transcript_69591:241-1152(-)
MVMVTPAVVVMMAPAVVVMMTPAMVMAPPPSSCHGLCLWNFGLNFLSFRFHFRFNFSSFVGCVRQLQVLLNSAHGQVPKSRNAVALGHHSAVRHRQLPSLHFPFGLVLQPGTQARSYFTIHEDTFPELNCSSVLVGRGSQGEPVMVMMVTPAMVMMMVMAPAPAVVVMVMSPTPAGGSCGDALVLHTISRDVRASGRVFALRAQLLKARDEGLGEGFIPEHCRPVFVQIGGVQLLQFLKSREGKPVVPMMVVMSIAPTWVVVVVVVMGVVPAPAPASICEGLCMLKIHRRVLVQRVHDLIVVD